MNWNMLAAVVVAGLVAWMGYRGIKNQPGLFTKLNFFKTTGTLGYLALILIAVIAFCGFLLRN